MVTVSQVSAVCRNQSHEQLAG